ncbi:unnamed protein product [Cuscuta europaea]|uniref:Late embryogenesis abundant protein LEA-2 subgroup domain-containing protein n=1 Tax=Cuscuta europaea TaxID=41803 RepID=A0A9P1DYZ6_CUSEU|nr:unnamed protein product [Cuscuta europaea]
MAHRTRKGSKCGGCCNATFGLGIVVIIVLIVGVPWFFYHIYKPKVPVYSVVGAAVMPNYTLTDDGKLTAKFTVNLTSNNPNENDVAISYGIATVLLYLDDEAKALIAFGTLPPLEQPAGTAANTSTLNLYGQEVVLEPNTSTLFIPAPPPNITAFPAVIQLFVPIHYDHKSRYDGMLSGACQLSCSSNGFEGPFPVPFSVGLSRRNNKLFIFPP